MKHNTTDDRLLDVVVVGGSQAGLAMAWHLARQGLRFVVLEAGPELGHTWRGRWDSLKLFTPAQYDALPGMAFPAPVDSYPTKDPVADYLQAYAEALELPVRLNAHVTRLRRVGDAFEASTGEEVLGARQVVATGPFQVPYVPPSARGLDGSVTQLHSAAYRNPQALPDGPVLVVGGGNSGFQIAEELAATRQVDLSIGSKNPMLPQRLGGRDLFWWLTRLGLMRVTGNSRLGRRIQARGEFVIGSSRRRLRRAGVRFRPHRRPAAGHRCGRGRRRPAADRLSGRAAVSPRPDQRFPPARHGWCARSREPSRASDSRLRQAGPSWLAGVQVQSPVGALDQRLAQRVAAGEPQQPR